MSANVSDAPGEAVKDRKPLVTVMILLTVTLFLGAEGLLFYRWATVREPNSILEVIGSDRLIGAEVSVSGLGLLEPHRAVMGDAGRLALPFYLDAGTYLVHVELHGETIWDKELPMKRDHLQQLDLTKVIDLTRLPSPPTTAPTAGAAP